MKVNAKLETPAARGKAAPKKGKQRWDPGKIEKETNISLMKQRDALTLQRDTFKYIAGLQYRKRRRMFSQYRELRLKRQLLADALLLACKYRLHSPAFYLEKAARDR